MQKLEEQFRTDTMAAAEHMSQILETFMENGKRDLEALEKDWKKRHREMVSQGTKTVAAATAELRQPVYRTCEELGDTLMKLEERARVLKSSISYLDIEMKRATQAMAIKTKIAADETQAVIEAHFAQIRAGSNEERRQLNHLQLSLLVGIGLGLIIGLGLC